MVIKMNKVTRKFTKEQMYEWGLPYENERLVRSNQMLDHTRWSLVYELVFQAPDDGKLWSLCYEEPATEHQECERWPDLTGVQVEAYTVTTTRFREVEVVDGNQG